MIEGAQTPEEKIADAKKRLSKITTALKKEKDMTLRADLEAQQIQVASELKFLEDTLAEIKKAEDEADPAAA